MEFKCEIVAECGSSCWFRILVCVFSTFCNKTLINLKYETINRLSKLQSEEGVLEKEAYGSILF